MRLFFSYFFIGLAMAQTFTDFPRWENWKKNGLELKKSDPVRVPVRKIEASELPQSIPDGTMSLFKRAVQRQLDRCDNHTYQEAWIFPPDRYVTQEEWCQATLTEFQNAFERFKTFAELYNWAKENFDWYQSLGGDGEGNVHYTGYYLPLLEGKRIPDKKHFYPIYLRPHDLLRLRQNGKKRWIRKLPDGSYTRHFSRHEIDWKDALIERDLEIVYVNDPIEAFFLHIQGSGRVLIKDEFKKIFINYAAANGHSYVSIGKVLRKEGIAQEYLTLQGLRRYFRERPSEVDRVFPMNPSYIFFKEMAQGPYGRAGALLSPGHSIATDYHLYPTGAIALIKTQRPIIENGQMVGWRPFTRLVANQDSGGAIRGAGRVDVYWGEGAYAEWAAGQLSDKAGKLFFLLPKKL